MKKRIVPLCVLAFTFLLGTAILCYPFVSSRIAQKNRNLEILQHDRTVQNMEQEQLRMEWEKARAYNQSNVQWNGSGAFSSPGNGPLANEYLNVMSLNGIVGYIDIPAIGVYLPIQHGTSESVLKKAVGHLPYSNLPIGGSGNHAVLAGHTGLPSATLFDNLVKLELGDSFHLHILDKTFTYRIDDILVVHPSDGNLLPAPNNEDYVTLVTCTPYGVNSHRLLVRGSRTVEDTYPADILPAIPPAPLYKDSGKILYKLLAALILAFTGAAILGLTKHIKRKSKQHPQKNKRT